MVDVNFLIRGGYAQAGPITAVAFVAELVSAATDHVVASLGFLHPASAAGTALELILPEAVYEGIKVQVDLLVQAVLSAAKPYMRFHA